MSGVPKRSHEDAAHHSSKHLHQDSGTYSGLMPSGSNDHHIPFDMGQDFRVAEAPLCTEFPDAEKERSDHRSSIPVNNNSSDNNKSAKEDRDAEKLERERKVLLKEIESSEEVEKDQSKRESWNGMEKEALNDEKELGDRTAKTTKQVNVLLEQKKQKDVDSLVSVDGDSRERMKESDGYFEGDGPDKVSKIEKQSEDGSARGERTAEKEKEIHNYSFRHRKSSQRSRGSPLVANREAHFRSHAHAPVNDMSEGKAEVSSVVYKVGESMQELIKLWKDYELSQSQMENIDESSNSGPTLVIRIPVENVTATNPGVRGCHLWGTDIYTYDSDMVAVLMHTGYICPTASPHAAIQELCTTIRVLPPQDCYISTLRNNVRSRAWVSLIDCSYKVERCCIVKKGGGTIDLESCLAHTSTAGPSLAPMNALRQQRFAPEVTILYNLCNEPWMKYSINVVADKGLEKALYTSARLKMGQVLYLETHSRRYELCFNGEKMVKAIPATQMHDPDSEQSQNHYHHSTNGDKTDSDDVMVDVFRWSRCKIPLPQEMMLSIGIPLPLEHVEVLEENLDWEDILWSETGVWIAGKEYTLARVHFMSMN